MTCGLLECRLPEETDNELGGKQSHGHESQPRVQRIKVGNGLLGQIVVVEHGQESNYDTRNGAGMEQHMDQLHVDRFHAPAQSVHKNGCK